MNFGARYGKNLEMCFGINFDLHRL
jgi:hypothetical protein